MMFLQKHSLSSVIIVCAAILLLGGAACTVNDHSKRVTRVDSLQQRLKSLEERADKIDTAQARKIMERAEKELELFNTYFENDSMGESLFNVLDSYKRTKEVFEGYGGQLRRVHKELDKSRKKLKALKKDLKKGRLSGKKADGYIEDEEKVLLQLKKSVSKLEKQTKAVFENYKGRSEKLREHLNLPDSVQWPDKGEQ